jgi:hypothetical protein
VEHREVYKVEVYARIRRAVQVDGISIRQAAREFGLSRKTIRKMMQFSLPPGYARKKPVQRPKLGPWLGIIDQILADDYYHCTGHRGKCPEPYTREEAMQDQLADSLRALVIPRGVLNWLQATVAESDLTERAARERETKRLEEQHRRINSKLEAMYEDRLEGRISPEMYDRKARELREQALELSRRINEVQASAPAPVQDAIDLMDLTSRAADLFVVQPAPEKQRFMRLVMKDATWRDGQLQTQFEEPFENLRRSNQLSQTKHEENGMRNAEIGIWLRRKSGCLRLWRGVRGWGLGGLLSGPI